MKRFIRILSCITAVALLVPGLAFAVGFSAGNGTYGVYIKSGSICQTWYGDNKPVVETDAAYLLGVSDGYVYYQDKESRLIKAPVHLLSDEYANAADSLENISVAVTANAERRNTVLSNDVNGHALLDEATGYIYYVSAANTAEIHVIAELPALGIVNNVLYTASCAVKQLFLSTNGLAFTLADGSSMLYLQLIANVMEVNADFSKDTRCVMFNGYSVVLGSDGTMFIRLDEAYNTLLTINDSVQDFAVLGNYIYYLRKTRWLTEVDRFDIVTRASKVMCRTLKELMPQIVSAGDYLYLMDTDYTVYKMSPTSGKFATFMKLANNYKDYAGYEPRLLSAGEELLVYDHAINGSDDTLEFFYNAYVGTTEHPTPAPEPAATPEASATPTPAPTTYATMQRGSKGDSVKLLQELLVRLGYLNDSIDGVFGAKLVTAVEQLQSDLGLQTTGKVDNALMQKLLSGEVEAYSPYTELNKGDKNYRVTALQTRLKELGYLNAAADGAYGQATANAVALFQKQNGLEETGTADSITLEAVYSPNAPKCIN